MADSPRHPPHGDGVQQLRGLRLGVGSASAVATLIAAAILSGLVVLAFVERWNILVLLVIAIAWAIVFGGFVVVPMVASLTANALSQSGGARPVTPPTTDPPSDDASGGQGRPHVRRATDIGLGVQATKGLMARPTIVTTTSGFDWVGLVHGVAVRLEDVLGEGFSAQAEGGAGLTLRHSNGMSRKVNLGSIFQPPPLDVAERALRGCLKMMDEAQMFAMRVQRDPWPSRGGTRDIGPGNLARPRVRIDDGEITLSWVDSWGTMLRLPTLPFDGASPAARDATW